MPKSFRWKLKRKLKASRNNLDNSQEKLVWVGSHYKEDHPEIYKAFAGLVTQIDSLKEVIKDLENNI